MSNTLATPAEGSDSSISRSDPSAGVKGVVNMLLHTGRSGLCPSDLCLFKRDLCRGPYSIILNSLYMIIRTTSLLMRHPCTATPTIARHFTSDVSFQSVAMEVATHADGPMDPSTHHRTRRQLYESLCEWEKIEMQLSICFVASQQLLSCNSPIA